MSDQPSAEGAIHPPPRFPTTVRGCYQCAAAALPGTPYARLVAELPLGHDGLAHRTYNRLLRGGVYGAAQITGWRDKDFKERIDGFGRGMITRIRTVVPKPAGEGTAVLTEDARILRCAAQRVIDEIALYRYEFARALADALREAADEVERCERINARKAAGEVLELVSPTVESLLAAARSLTEPAVRSRPAVL